MEDAKRLTIAAALRGLGLGANLVDVAEILWAAASVEPGHVAVVTVADLGLRLRKDNRCIRRWLAELDGAGTIRILSREKRWGAYKFSMPDPLGALRVHHDRRQADTQTMLEAAQPATLQMVPPRDYAARSADMASAVGAQRGHDVRARGSEPARSADMASALRRPGDAPIKLLAKSSEAERAAALEVTRAARAALRPSGTPAATHAHALGKGNQGNTSLEGTGKRERQREEPCNQPTRETSAPADEARRGDGAPDPLAVDFARTVASMPDAGETATRRRELAAEFEQALGVGEHAWPAFFANVAAVVHEARGPDGAALTREKVLAIIRRAWGRQPHDQKLRAQYATKAITAEAKRLCLPWPRDPPRDEA